MPKRTVRRVVFFVAAVVLAGSAYLIITQDSPEEKKDKQIQNGMTLAEVEAILGPGERALQSEVPSHPVAVNPDEEAAFIDRHRKAGTMPTAREYATKLRHFVEGDLIYHWRSASRNNETWVAFRDGKVCEKWFHDRNYL